MQKVSSKSIFKKYLEDTILQILYLWKTYYSIFISYFQDMSFKVPTIKIVVKTTGMLHNTAHDCLVVEA